MRDLPLPRDLLGAALATALLALAAATLAAHSGSLTASAPQVRDTTPLPLSFTRNVGQTDERVRYYAQGSDHAFYFTPDKVRLAFRGEEKGIALDLTPLGTGPDATLEARERGRGRVNYIQGSERYTNIPSYHEVAYRDLWPGIDLVFRGQDGKLKYEFRLRPGADPGRVRLAYGGADALAIGAAGNLLIQTPVGTLRDSRPRSYQRVGGRRVAVDSRYRLLKQGGRAYGFALGTYDSRRPLVIDPGLEYSTFLGGAENETADAIAVDSSGNAYVAGYTESTDFPKTVGAFDSGLGGGADAFITKLDSAGGLAYSTYLGGSVDEFSSAIALDGGGNAYVTGSTTSPDFPTTAGAFDQTHNGADDGFVAKLDATGSSLDYSTFLGTSSSFEDGQSIAVDAGGSAYVTGSTRAPDFPTTAGAFDTSFGGSDDGFVTKFNSTGSALDYSTYLGGDSYDLGFGVAVDASGNAYVAGWTASGNFPTTPSALDPSFNGGDDAFVTKLDATGSALAYSTFLGGIAGEIGYSIDVDGSGGAYVAGATDSPDFPTTAGAFDATLDGFRDAFVTKLDALGSALDYSTFLGGSGIYDTAWDVTVDGSGNAYVAGWTESPDFPTTAGSFDTSYGGGAYDGVVSKLNGSGSGLDYSTYLGEASHDFALGVAVDGSGDMYVAGYTGAPDFPTTAGAFDQTHNGADDGFVMKLDPSPAGTLVIRKDAQADHPQDFGFTAAGGLSPTSFSLDDDSDGALPSYTYFGVAPGSGYSVSETAPPWGWELAEATCDDGSPVSNIDISAGESVTCTFVNRQLGYARPVAASPLFVRLVPAFHECTDAANAIHGEPLDSLASCDPSIQSSGYLTFNAPEREAPYQTSADGTGSVILKVTCLGSIEPPAESGDTPPCNASAGDQIDVKMTSTSTDVRCVTTSGGCAGAGSTYNGSVLGLMPLRMTDRLNGPSGDKPGTAEDHPFTWGIQCAAGACSSETSADAVIPGLAKEKKRTVWELGQVQLLDGGFDGDLATAPSPASGTCPPACMANGDETVFLRQGLFAP